MNERMPAGGLSEILLSHLDSAYNLAHWLVRNAADADDVVQEAYLRAFQYSDGFRGGDARAWLFAIVRNTAYTWLRKMRPFEPVIQFDEQIATAGAGVEMLNPEELLLQKGEGRFVEKAMSELPVRFREILILRELEGFSYKQIAEVMGMPIGTVMSTLSRARERFRHAAHDLLKTHGSLQSEDAAGRKPGRVEADPGDLISAPSGS
jgi:RNA polymerase sigma-70 factor (ECF subfamily)